MKNAKNTRLHVWELALLLALAAAILWGAASLSRQEDLGRKVIRLHVIANSDSPEDQALKLRVRDRVLARAQELLEQSADMAQAQEVLTSALPELTREAQQVLAAAGWPATASGPGWSRRNSPPRTMTASLCPPGNTWPCGSSSGRAGDRTGGAWCFRRCAPPPPAIGRTPDGTPGWRRTTCP